MALSAEQIAQYRRDGYVCPVPVMTSPEALQLRMQLEAVEARQGGKLEPAQRSRAFLLFKWLDDLIRDPRVLDPVEQLIGPDILCWSTIFWIKDAGSKSFAAARMPKCSTRICSGRPWSAWNGSIGTIISTPSLNTWPRGSTGCSSTRSSAICPGAP